MGTFITNVRSYNNNVNIHLGIKIRDAYSKLENSIWAEQGWTNGGFLEGNGKAVITVISSTVNKFKELV